VGRQIYDYLPSRKASPPIGWHQIILLGDRSTRVLTTWVAGIRTRNLLITSPTLHRAAQKHITVTEISQVCTHSGVLADEDSVFLIHLALVLTPTTKPQRNQRTKHGKNTN